MISDKSCDEGLRFTDIDLNSTEILGKKDMLTN